MKYAQIWCEYGLSVYGIRGYELCTESVHRSSYGIQVYELYTESVSRSGANTTDLYTVHISEFVGICTRNICIQFIRTR